MTTTSEKDPDRLEPPLEDHITLYMQVRTFIERDKKSLLIEFFESSDKVKSLIAIHSIEQLPLALNNMLDG